MLVLQTRSVLAALAASSPAVTPAPTPPALSIPSLFLVALATSTSWRLAVRAVSARRTTAAHPSAEPAASERELRLKCLAPAHCMYMSPATEGLVDFPVLTRPRAGLPALTAAAP